ncbi:tetratricopeptide repeat protein [Rhodopila sp.]|jgi:tetratricopeptide (TPR) repeat protein|uniref:tetratricopeptide repeat protein n=1 Tax=Rhodopila sp. TaxID=2480087 RepID=UPI002CEB03B0|nr:tetratricopeptide repeat protein [Rhodopila sp.]HVZ07823.1 tetratricopeptide repeat protein [Rhodopila sp.]
MAKIRVALICGALPLAGIAGAAGWWVWSANQPGIVADDDLPVPPFPPRIAEGDTYESCLASLASDPQGAIAIADSWQATGGGDGAAHCRGLALIALGHPEDGATVLEQLAARTSAPALGKASLLYQAAQARLMVDQAEQARDDATAALRMAADDVDLMITRASAEADLGAIPEAIRDLTDALLRDSTRSEALIARATLYRKLGRIDLAQADIDKALTMDPDSPDALLERGILRQRTGDLTGAREDWEHARGADPDSTTADLADQNLSLLDAGPAKQQ